MRLNTLRKNMGYYFEQNKVKYFLLLLVLAAGVTAGILFACSVGAEESGALAKNLKDAFLNMESKSRGAIFISFLQKNLKCIAAVIIGTLTVYLIPVLFINIGVWGFSIGFTAGFITLYFGVNGFVMASSLIMTQVLFMIPLVMFLSVTAIDYTLHNIRNKKALKKENRKKLLVLCTTVFVFLMLFSLIDVFIVPSVINTVSALM